MKRTLTIGDIHSGKKGLQQVLDRANVTEQDHLIFLGDYVDGWSDAHQTIDFLITLRDQYNCTFIRGNHDDLCLNYLTKSEAPENWLLHGGKATKDSYDGLEPTHKELHIAFLQNLEDYRIDHQNRLFLHAGFTNLRGVEQEYFSKMFYWDRTLWELSKVVERTADEELPPRLKRYNEIFIGHTPISKDSFVSPQRAANVWNLDPGAVFMGGVTILDVNTKEYWQSSPLNELYQGETGRNRAPK